MNDWVRRLLNNKWLLGLAALGVLLLVFGAGGGLMNSPTGSSVATQVVAPSTGVEGAAVAAVQVYEKQLDSQLQHMLDQIAGISNTLVMVRADATTSERFGEDVTTSRSTTNQGSGGGQQTTVTTSSQTQLVTISSQNGAQVPVVTQQQLPHIAGVLVVAKGIDVVQMESEITSAVQDVLGIPAYEITVLPRHS